VKANIPDPLKGDVMIEIKHRITGAVLFSLKTRSVLRTSAKACLEAAIKANADLRYADLSSEDLRHADLSSEDLRHADLRHADLRYADLRYADLRYADLRSADLRYADLDFSSGLSFRCSSFGFTADVRLAAQIAYHFCRIDFGDCEEAKAAQTAITELANKFHRVEECGRIT
jgi:uncharacterized protein YjbI with pentapeptide repeats